MTKDQIINFYTSYGVEFISENGNFAKARCPFRAWHKDNDSHPSVSINLRNGWFECFAEGIKKPTWDFKILWEKRKRENPEGVAGDPKPVKPKPREKPKPKDKPIAEYLYQDQQGDTVFKVVRGRYKKFWVEPTGIKPNLLYSLPEVLQAQIVWIVEGEKDADNLNKEFKQTGRVATTNPLGAGKWRDEYCQYLKNAKEIYIVADRDDPGVKHGKEVLASIKKILPTTPVKLTTALPHKDISDMLKKETIDYVIDFIENRFREDPEVDIYEQRKVSLEEVKATIEKWLYFPDYSVIEVLLASYVISLRRETDPVWVLLVGPPSTGKTELLTAFYGADKTIEISTLTPQALVSGKVREKERGTEKDPSLFAHIDGKVLVVKDFTSLLSTNQRDQEMIFAMFRESYDGNYAKKFGVHNFICAYKTHHGLIGGVTPEIDRFTGFRLSMGERFLFYRIENDPEKVLAKVNETDGRDADRKRELRQAVGGFLNSFVDDGRKIDWDNEGLNILEAETTIVTAVRTPVRRDWREKDLMLYQPEREMLARYYKSLKRLGDGLCLIRGKDRIGPDELRIVVKVGLDYLPKQITTILQVLYHNPNQYIHKTLMHRLTGFSQTTVRRIIDDLLAIGVLDVKARGVADSVQLKPEFREALNSLVEFLPAKWINGQYYYNPKKHNEL